MNENSQSTFDRLLALTKKTSEVAEHHGITLSKQKTYATAMSLAISG